MKLSEWKLYSIYALGHILQGSPEADKKYLIILNFNYYFEIVHSYKQ